METNNTPSEKDLARIKKLLALSKSDNTHEAELAAERAAALMAKNQISEAELGGFDSDELKINEFTLDEAGQLTHWQARAAQAAAAAFGGQVYSEGGIVREDGSEYTRADFVNKVPYKKRTQIKFIGRQQDVSSVAYLYGFFCNEIRRLATEAWDTNAKTDRMFQSRGARSWKDSFRKGCASRISERIQEQRAKTKAENQCQALVKVETYEKEAEEFLDSKGCKSVASKASNQAAYANGWNAGNNVNTQGGGPALGAAKEQITKGKR